MENEQLVQIKKQYELLKQSHSLLMVENQKLRLIEVVPLRIHKENVAPVA